MNGFISIGFQPTFTLTRGRSFENNIISHLYSMYNIKQSMTMPYNLHGNSICGRFNQTLLDHKDFAKRTESRLAFVYIPSLVFAYNVTPHSITGYQPYELMFGFKVPTVFMLGWVWLAMMTRPQPASVLG